MATLFRKLFVVFPLFTLSLAAAPIGFMTTFSGAAEEPPNASAGTGSALVMIDPIAHTMSISASFFGLLGTTTAAHIHVINGPGDSNTGDTVGPVATTTPSFAGFPLGVSSGSYSDLLDMTSTTSYRPQFIVDSGGTTATAEAAIFAAIMEGRAYFNIHSSVFPGGEIRGFLEPVPEASTMLLAGIGLIGLGLIRYRRT